MDAAPKAQPRDLAHWVILVAGVGLRRRRRTARARGVRRPARLPRAYGDPEAWWPIAVNLTAGLVSFGTWRWVNRRNSRPFAVVLLGLGLADRGGARVRVVRRVPGRRAQHRLERRHPRGRAGDQQLRRSTCSRRRDCDTGRGAAGAAVRAADAADRAAGRRHERGDGAAAHPGRPGRGALVAAALGGARRSTPRRRRCCRRWPRTPSATRSRSSPRTRWRRGSGQARAAGWRVVITDPQPGRDAGPAARPARAGRHALRRLAVLAPGQHRGAAADVGRPGRGRGPQVGHRQPPGARPAPDGRGLAGRGLAAPLPEPDPGLDRRHDQRERGHRPAPRRPHGRAGRRPRAARRPVRPDLRGGRRARPARPRARPRSRPPGAAIPGVTIVGQDRGPRRSRSTRSPSAGSATAGSTGSGPRPGRRARRGRGRRRRRVRRTRGGLQRRRDRRRPAAGRRGSGRRTPACSSTPGTPRSPAWAPSRCSRRSARSARRSTPARAGRSTAGSGSRGWCTRTSCAPTPTPTTPRAVRGTSWRRSTASRTSGRCSPSSAQRSPSAAAGGPAADDRVAAERRAARRDGSPRARVVARAPPAQRLDLRCRPATGPPRSTRTCCRGTSSPTRAGPRTARAFSRAWPCWRRWATARSTTPTPPGCGSGAAARSPPYAATSRGPGPPPTAPRCTARPATGR